jgi:NAD(P)-dependent dehydrogenase (short-subunit alcohol dehydrogenase family)
MSELDGRVAIITGAGSGLGRAVAQRMTREGAHVVVADINGDSASRAVTEIEAAGGSAMAATVDVSAEDDIRRLVHDTVARFGRIDILHNNAAALGMEVFSGDNDVIDMEVDVWDRTMAVNLRGAMLGCKHVIPVMRDNGGGAIVNTASLSALIGERTHLAYACSKAALGALTRHVATQHGHENIRINSVAPGLMMTPVVHERLDEHELAAFRAERLVERATEPDDVANLVVFLASDKARCITGQVYVIDGGTLAKRPRMAMRDWDEYLSRA